MIGLSAVFTIRLQRIDSADCSCLTTKVPPSVMRDDSNDRGHWTWGMCDGYLSENQRNIIGSNRRVNSTCVRLLPDNYSVPKFYHLNLLKVMWDDLFQSCKSIIRM
jgi:hypothetical protein